MATNVTTGVIAGLACVTLLVGAGVQAQQKRGKVMKLTGEDYAEIQMLSAKYGHAIDSCSDNGYGYRTYTADGTFIDMWTDRAIKAGGEKWVGREKLREIASGANVTGTPCSSSRFNGSVSHLILNIVITPSAEGATGNAYMVELGGRDPNRIARMGNYEDVYVKTPEGWRFKVRTHSRAPNGQKVVAPAASAAPAPAATPAAAAAPGAPAAPAAPAPAVPPAAAPK